MEDFVNGANFKWNELDAVSLAAWALWRLNYIHPFVNGNGRTARAVCYFVVCVKSGGLLSGYPILPELLVQHRKRYCDALAAVDASLSTSFDITPIHSLVAELLAVQLNVNTGQDAPPPPALPPPPPPPPTP
jgi:Fic family protein